MKKTPEGLLLNKQDVIDLAWAMAEKLLADVICDYVRKWIAREGPRVGSTGDGMTDVDFATLKITLHSLEFDGDVPFLSVRYEEETVCDSEENGGTLR